MKFALRRLFKTPAFALTAIVTVGAAIGANALIFSVVNGVVLKPLPYADPSSLVGVWHVAPGVMAGPLQQSAGTYFMEREAAQSFTDIGLWDDGSVTVTGLGEPEQVDSLSAHMVNLTNPMMMRGPIRELFPIGPLHVSLRLPEGRAPRDVRLVVSNADAKFQVADQRLVLTIPSITDHELIVVTL